MLTSGSDTQTLSNASTTSFDWTATKTQSWLTLSSTGGTMTSGSSVDLTIIINAFANSLPAGEYTDTVTITDTTNGTVIERDVVLTVTRDVIEGFSPDAGQGLDISIVPQMSIDTGYSWRGYHDATNLYLMGQLNFSGAGIGYDSWNAWTQFNGGHVKNLGRISFKWHASSTSGNLEARVVIKDANGDWFVSDDAVADTADKTFMINSTTATWKILNSDPVINTPFDIGLASTPDLSKVYGGGILTVGLGTGEPIQLDTLSFISDGNPTSFNEDFTPTESDWEVINWTPEISADTGYSWSGCSGGSWGSALYDNVGVGTFLHTNGQGVSYENVNAWTTFDGDYVEDILEIKIEMAPAGYTNSGSANIEAVIQDADGYWFVSDDTAADTAGTTGVIDATTTTWRKLNNAPVISVALDVGAAGTPDLSKVYGGGVNYRHIAGHVSVAIESLTFIYYETDPPMPDTAGFASPPAAVSICEITMTAITGVDDNGPVEYYFDETSGNPGGTDSGWQTGPVYNDTGLDREVQYTYTVQMRDAVPSTPNVGAVSLPSSATTIDYIISEGFRPTDSTWEVLHDTYNWIAGTEVSADTAYTWSGYDASWGLAMYGDAAQAGLVNVALGKFGTAPAGSNAWTIFNGESIANLATIEFVMDPASDNGTVTFEAIIQDANGDWFVSDDTAAAVTGTTTTIDALSTTWRTIDPPVWTTAIVPGAAGDPNLSSVLGGGLNFLGYSSGSVKLDSMTFISALYSYPPAWDSDPVAKAAAAEGMAYSDTLATDASDPDVGDVLTFSKISGPSWLTVAPDGQLSGVAADGDTGPNEFVVRVTDSEGFYDEATMDIYVFIRFTGELGLSDLAAFAPQWLGTDCGACGGTDLDGDGDNDLADWAIFSGYWLK